MPSSPTTAELRDLLSEVWTSERDHVERLSLAAAVLVTALQNAGMRATLVGGGAVEFHAPGAYTTSDIDLVVEGRDREAVDEVMTSLGLRRSGRHWTRGTLYVEVPGNWMPAPVEEIALGPLTLRVVRKEHVLGERIVGFRHWKAWAHGQQALAMIQAFGDELDEDALRQYLRSEGAEDAYDLLRRMNASEEPITAQTLDQLWHRHYR